MKTFSYQGFRKTGQHARGLVEAIDLKEARERLASQGILAEKLVPAGQPSAGGRGLFGKRKTFSLKDRSLVYRELSALLQAGLSLDHALDIIIETPELGATAERVARVRDEIREGGALSTSLAAASERVSVFESSILDVGERTGALPMVLDRVSDFLEEEDTIREKIQTALIYPGFILGMALVVAVVLLGVMMPNFQKLLGEMNIDLPPLTELVLGLGKFFSTFGIPLLGLLALGAWFLVRRYRQHPTVRRKWQRHLLRLPLLGKTVEALINLRFARTLSLLLGGGVQLSEALPLAGRATGNDWVSELVEQEAEKVRQGSSLADAISRVEPLSASLPGWIRAGEESGQLQDLLERAAARYHRAWDKRVNRLLSLLEPIIILVVGLFVLIVAMAVLQPILSMNDSISPGLR